MYERILPYKSRIREKMEENKNIYFYLPIS